MKDTHKIKLKELFSSFLNGIRNRKSEAPKKYLESIGLNHEDLNIGFNSGQFHHRKSEEFRKPFIDMGILRKSYVPVNDPNRTAYTCFGFYSVVFALKNKLEEITNLYSVRFKMDTVVKEFLNDECVYPSYPHLLTKRVFICDNVINTASLIQSKTLENREATISLFDGEIKPQHEEILQSLGELEEVIYISNSTDTTTADKIKELLPSKIKLSVAVLPDGEDLNTMLVNYDSQGILKFLNERKTTEIENEIEIISSDSEKSTSKRDEVISSDSEINYNSLTSAKIVITKISTLDFTNLKYPKYIHGDLEIEIQNGINTELHDLSRLRLSLKITYQGNVVLRDTLNSTQTDTVKAFVRKLKNVGVEIPAIDKIFNDFINEVESYFLSSKKTEAPKNNSTISESRKQLALDFLKQDNLLDALYTELTKVGIVGEKNNSMLLLLTSISRMLNNPLSAICTSSKADTSNLLSVISEITCDEDVRELDAISSNVIGVDNDKAITNKLLVAYEISNLKKSFWALEAIISRKKVFKETVKKNVKGYLESTTYRASGNIAFIGATQSGTKLPETIKQHSLLLALTENKEQELLQLQQESKKYSGIFQKDASSIQLLKDIQTLLKQSSVIIKNPYAEQLIPEGNLNYKVSLYQQLLKLIEVIAFVHQFQIKRSTASNNTQQITVTPEHIKSAITLIKPVIFNQEDVLTTKQRKFFNQCTEFLKKNSTAQFTNKDIQQFGGYLNRKIVNDYLRILDNKGFLEIAESDLKNGNTYRIVSDNSQYDELVRVIDLLEKSSQELMKVASVTLHLKRGLLH